jgi:hypothetical protein
MSKCIVGQSLMFLYFNIYLSVMLDSRVCNIENNSYPKMRVKWALACSWAELFISINSPFHFFQEVIFWSRSFYLILKAISWDSPFYFSKKVNFGQVHFIVRVILNVADSTVTVKCRTAIKSLFLYFNICLSVMLDSLSCSFTLIYV